MTGKWNPWHGCHKFSEGCAHCYVYRIDGEHGKDSSVIYKTSEYNLPARIKKDGKYALPSGHVYTCISSDFFLEDADEWRSGAWDMMRSRPDIHFYIITKRIARFENCIPDDWGRGWDNVTISCTAENQRRADERLPVLCQAPIKHREVICEPLLEAVDIEKWLGAWIERVTVGGESGSDARICDIEWVKSIKRQCIKRGVRFYFKQTGACFRDENGTRDIPRALQFKEARKALL